MKRIQTSLAKGPNLRKAGRIVLAALLLLTGVALSNGTPLVDWWVIGGGGGHTDAAPYALDGTAGQSVAGVVSNDPYLCYGFWCRPVGVEYEIYLPVVLRNFQ